MAIIENWIIEHWTFQAAWPFKQTIPSLTADMLLWKVIRLKTYQIWPLFGTLSTESSAKTEPFCEVTRTTEVFHIASAILFSVKNIEWHRWMDSPMRCGKRWTRTATVTVLGRIIPQPWIICYFFPLSFRRCTNNIPPKIWKPLPE